MKQTREILDQMSKNPAKKRVLRSNKRNNESALTLQEQMLRENATRVSHDPINGNINVNYTVN